MEVVKGANLKRDRYSEYKVQSATWNKQERLKFIQNQIRIAHEKLVQKTQLDELLEVLKYPTDREPVEGMY
jgi:hypothetical protein